MENDVNALANAMVAAKKISGQWPLNELLAIFDTLTTYDVRIKAKTARIKKFTTSAFIAFAVSIVLTIIVANIAPTFGGVTIALMVITLVGGIIGAILKSRCQKQDLRNEFRAYVRPLLEHLQDDLKKDSPVNLELDLSPVEQKQFRKGKSDPYSAGIYHKCYDEHFERNFLTLKLRLSDGNRLMLTGAEFLTKTSKTKKNPRGKLKTKTIHKKRVLFDARLIVEPENFGCKQLPTRGTQKFYAKQSNGNTILGVKFAEKFKGAPVEMVPDPFLTLQQIVTLYTFLDAKTVS